MYGFAILALAASVSANVMVDSQCPFVSTVWDFDFKKFGQGTWYEIARYPNSAEEGAECGWAEHTLNGDTTEVKNYHVVNNTIKIIEGTYKLAPYAGKLGKVIVSLPYGANGAVTENVLNVLVFTKEYLVGYYCKSYPNKNNHQDFAWVLSRSQTPSVETKAAIEKFLKDSKVLDSSKFVWPSFSDASCKVQEDSTQGQN